MDWTVVMACSDLVELQAEMTFSPLSPRSGKSPTGNGSIFMSNPKSSHNDTDFCPMEEP